MTEFKFPKSSRTFETRLLFINSLFSSVFPQIDIMAHCVTHKLDRSYLSYSEELRLCKLNLIGQDPLMILNHIE